MGIYIFYLHKNFHEKKIFVFKKKCIFPKRAFFSKNCIIYAFFYSYANIMQGVRESVKLIRRVRTLRETDFRGHWRVDLWYRKMKSSVPNFIS